MNHEHPSHADNHEQHQEPRDSPRLAAALRKLPTNRQERHLLDDLYTEHGAAFKIYLERIWTPAITINEVEADFLNVYWASYERIEHFLDDMLEAIEILRPLKDALKDNEMAAEVFDWLYVGLLDSMKDDYEFVAGDGMIHVFHAKQPARAACG